MTCGHSRYKPRTGKGKTLVAYKKLRYFLITPKLQRLFMSPRTAEHITWHQLHDAIDGVMLHPSDGEAWKHFNSVHPHFSAESRNVRLGLCTDGFNPFGSFPAPYSCWPVILTVITCHRECVWGRSSCIYLLSYPVQAAQAGIQMFVFDHWLMSWHSCGPPGLWLMIYRGNKFCYEVGFDVDYQWFSSL